MKVDFSAPILDLTGQKLVENDVKVTLGTIACTALTTLAPNEQNISADVKIKRFQLALLAAKGGNQEITPEQFVEIKELVGKLFGPLVVGRVNEILDRSTK